MTTRYIGDNGGVALKWQSWTISQVTARGIYMRDAWIFICLLYHLLCICDKKQKHGSQRRWTVFLFVFSRNVPFILSTVSLFSFRWRWWWCWSNLWEAVAFALSFFATFTSWLSSILFTPSMLVSRILWYLADVARMPVMRLKILLCVVPVSCFNLSRFFILYRVGSCLGFCRLRGGGRGCSCKFSTPTRPSGSTIIVNTQSVDRLLDVTV